MSRRKTALRRRSELYWYTSCDRPAGRPLRRRYSPGLLDMYDLGVTVGLKVGAEEEAGRWQRRMAGIVDAIDTGTIAEYAENAEAEQLAEDVEKWLKEEGQQWT